MNGLLIEKKKYKEWRKEKEEIPDLPNYKIDNQSYDQQNLNKPYIDFILDNIKNEKDKTWYDVYTDHPPKIRTVS